MSVNHDIVVIGGSAGGIEVLLDVVKKLPGDLAASVFVVVHTVPNRSSVLPEVLSAHGPLPATHPLHGEAILPGHIYVAPPDNHLYVRPTRMDIVRGPKENGHRPSVDALFRTASASFGPRVIGVVLSGYQDCGTAGMMSVKARGGIAVVQDPAQASAQDMPRHVLERVQVDHEVPPADLAGLLTRLVASPAGPAAAPDPGIEQIEGKQTGAAANLVCPLCQGVLTEAHRGSFDHFRCHVGHTFSLESLMAEQSESMERALWSAVRALEESASLSRRLSQSNRGELHDHFAEKAGSQTQQANLIRNFLLFGNQLSKTDAPKAKT